MLTIYGRPNSSNVAKVMWAVAELGLAYRRIDVGGPFGGTAAPEYRAFNPTGRIPTLVEEDGFALWESNAIVRHLASRHVMGGLCPEDPRRRAEADKWMDWASTDLAPLIDAVRQARRVPGRETDAAELTRRAGEEWSALEPVLRRQGFVAGGELTMGDIALGALVHRWHLLPGRPVLPGIAAWYERLLSRPAYASHVAAVVK